MVNESETQKILWWRHWSVVLIFAILAAVVLWFMLNLGPWLRSWQDQRAATAAQRQLEKAYREDKYGGKTPEETFDMFIAALEKSDVELASKYFVLNKQEQWRKTLEEYKEQSLLGDFSVELQNNKKSWARAQSNDSNIAQFDYTVSIEKDTYTTLQGEKIKVQKGDYGNRTIFNKYPSGVWKISVL